MNDVRNILIKALKAQIESVTSLKCYTIIPDGKVINYPYVVISEIYLEEVGPKTSYIYKLDTLINIIFEKQTSNTALWAKMNAITGLINNAEAFALDSPYKMIRCELNNAIDDLFESSTGVQSVGSIRTNFYIE